MTFYCPYCWHEIPESVIECPHCQRDLTSFSQLDYESKLLLALSHTVPENRRTAIELIGERHVARALPRFCELLNTEQDVYVLIDIVKALEKIGTPQALNALGRASHHSFAPVRHEAERLLNSHEQKTERL